MTSGFGEACSIARLSRTHRTSAGTFSGYGSLRGTVSLDDWPFLWGYISDLSVGEKTSKASVKRNLRVSFMVC